MNRCLRLGLALLAIALGSVPVFAEPLQLTYQPEKGLRVPYLIKASATATQILPDGRRQAVDLTISLKRTDTVKEVSEGKYVVERRADDIVVKSDGRPMDIPEGLDGQSERVEFDSQGRITFDEESPFRKLPPMDLLAETMNFGEFIPFGPDPVELGDVWDASGHEDDPEGARVDKSVSEGSLVAVYEEDGMKVALIQQTVEFSGLFPGTGDNPDMRYQLSGSILQSNRVEDGCLLGIKGNMEISIEFLDKSGTGVLAQRYDDFTATLEVAEE